jgi:hypothetical protein
VRKLRKPTAAAWLVNQLSRHAKRELRRWLRLVDRLDGARAGGDALRETAHEADAALADLVERAREIAEDLGQHANEATIDRVRETLQAAAVESEVRELVAEGRLDRERKAASVGFGALPSGASTGSRHRVKRRKPAPKKPSAAARKAVARARRDLANAERAEARATAAATKARRALEKAERAAR